jgi:hypothetical protein
MLSHHRVKILVVPLNIDKDKFKKYHALLQELSAVSLADLTPPDPKVGIHS